MVHFCVNLPRQTLDTLRKTLFLRFHFGAEPGDDGHGGVEGVPVHQTTVVPDEGQDAAQTSGFENRPGLAGADQLQDL